MKTYRLLFVCLILLCACKKDTTNSNSNPMPNPVNPEQYYFPPLTGDTWTTKSADSVGWNATLLQSAFDYAGTKNSFGMIILHNGRIVKEQYWNGWTKDSRYYIASAGKSVVALLTGIANQNGLINIKNEKWKNDFSPIDPNGATFADLQYSRAYLRHLTICNEILAAQIASIHNLGFYLWLVKEARKKIIAGEFNEWKNEMVKKLNTRL